MTTDTTTKRESWITKMQAEHEALRFAVAALIRDIPALGESRLAKLAGFPGGVDYADRDLGYKTCAEEVTLRARELSNDAWRKLCAAGVDLPSFEELHERELGPVTYEKRTGHTGEPNYETVYAEVPSRWNDVSVGWIVTSGNSTGVIVEKLRAGRDIPSRAAIVVQWDGCMKTRVEYAVNTQSLDGDPGDSRLEFAPPKKSRAK